MALANGCGTTPFFSASVSSVGALVGALRDAAAHNRAGRPALIEVVIPRDERMNPATLRDWGEPVVRCNSYAPPASVDPLSGWSATKRYA